VKSNRNRAVSIGCEKAMPIKRNEIATTNIFFMKKCIDPLTNVIFKHIFAHSKKKTTNILN
jgi:hypothetical protein